jgi:nucleoside-diphosphate-sugar epimerase
MKKAIVTGSAGFIGGHLVEGLLGDGWSVLGIDNMRSGLQSTVDLHIKMGNFHPKYVDIRSHDIDSIFGSFKPDVVFHLAAIPGVAPSVIDPVMSNDTNIGGTVNLLNASRKHGVERFIFSSSSSVYGGADTLPTQESAFLNPKSPYAMQKKVGEEYCRLFSNIYNLDTACLRYFNVFGPRQRADSAYAAVISAFCDSIKTNTPPVIYGDGEQSRDFCFVKNVVSANMLAAKYDGLFGGEPFNVGCGGRITVNSICKSLNTLSPEYRDERPGDVRHSQADISKSFDFFGYRPIVDYHDGLKETLGWFLSGE